MAISIKDVAKLSGVSVATVSRVLNNSDKVTGKTREKVLKTIENLRYVPNYSAKSLRTNISKGIGLVISHDVNYFITFPYFSEFISGMGQTLAGGDYHLVMVMSTDSRNDIGSHLRAFEKKIVGGVVLFDTMDGDKRIAILKKSNIPFIVVGRPNNVENYVYVDSDNEKGGMIATEHLFKRGCKRILFINGPKGHSASRLRLSGYLKAHEMFGIPVDKDLIVYVKSDSDAKNGYEVVKATLEETNFDGIFASGDLMATGAMKALEESGVRIGKDMPIIGFDDVPIASMISPSLTTIRQPIKDMGATVAKMLVDKMNGKSVKSKIFDVSLVIRKSTS